MTLYHQKDMPAEPQFNNNRVKQKASDKQTNKQRILLNKLIKQMNLINNNKTNT